MRICGGTSIPGEMAARMGLEPVYVRGDMACSEPEGVYDGLVCDADIYGVDKPAQYMKRYFESCSTHTDVINAVKKIQEQVRGGYAGAWKCNQNVYIFRDLIGLKPLYYCDGAFASERKAFSSPPCRLQPGELVHLPGNSLFSGTLKTIPTRHPEEILAALRESVDQSAEENAVILFSGGIDSSIVASLSNADVPLVVCGLEGSPDLVFAQRAARLLERELILCILSERDIKDSIPHVISIIDEKTYLNLEIGVLLYHICENCREKILFSGQGADELFGGYYKYENAFQRKEDVKALMKKDFDSISSGLERDQQVAEQFCKCVRYPYLDIPVVERALSIPVDSLFIPRRKEFLRKVAKLLSMPDEIVSRPKKALQYGSGIHKIIKKMNISL